jgi:hypothetical protein
VPNRDRCSSSRAGLDELIDDFVLHGFLARAVEPDGVVLAERWPSLTAS